MILEPESSSCRRLERLSQSALELSLIDFYESNATGGTSAALPLSSKHVSTASSHDGSSELASSCTASPLASTSSSQQVIRHKTRHPIRAFLTPPLMRKRKPNTSKHLLALHDVDHHASTSRLCTTNNLPGNSSPSSHHRGKSFGFLSLLKVTFVKIRFSFLYYYTTLLFLFFWGV